MQTTTKLPKGSIVALVNGWYAVVWEAMRSPKSEIVSVAVAGWECEMGSTYARDIQKINGEFMTLTMNEIQRRFEDGRINDEQYKYILSMAVKFTPKPKKVK